MIVSRQTNVEAVDFTYHVHFTRALFEHYKKLASPVFSSVIAQGIVLPGNVYQYLSKEHINPGGYKLSACLIVFA